MPFAAKSAVFRRLAEITDIASLTKQERLMYDESLRKFRDTIGVMEGARLSGVKQGREEGREEGITEGKIAVARRMKSHGMDAATISQMTDIPVEEINNL